MLTNKEIIEELNKLIEDGNPYVMGADGHYYANTQETGATMGNMTSDLTPEQQAQADAEAEQANQMAASANTPDTSTQTGRIKQANIDLNDLQ